MPAETMTDSASETARSAAKSAKDAAKSALETGQKGLNDAVDIAERSFGDATKRMEKALREVAEVLKVQSQSYRENAGEQFDEAQKYVVERVKERPVTATLAGLGVGLLLGLLLANRNSK